MEIPGQEERPHSHRLSDVNCRKPFKRGTLSFGCGQCRPCRINRQRQWKWRQWFESLTHEENCFVTLTYSDEHLVKSVSGSPTLSREDLRGFLARLRTSIYPRQFRYFAAAEYGPQTWRPHYHLSVFGLSPFGIVKRYGKQMYGHEAIYLAWGKSTPKNFVCAEFNEVTAAYVAKYVVKGLTNPAAPQLCGRQAEFSRMSLRPAIGSRAMEIVAQGVLNHPFGKAALEGSHDVPKVLKVGHKSVPLSRYLLRRLRQAVGFSPAEIALIRHRQTYDQTVEMSDLYKAALSAAGGSYALADQEVAAQALQRIIQVETRASIWKGKNSL